MDFKELHRKQVEILEIRNRNKKKSFVSMSEEVQIEKELDNEIDFKIDYKGRLEDLEKKERKLLIKKLHNEWIQKRLKQNVPEKEIACTENKKEYVNYFSYHK